MATKKKARHQTPIGTFNYPWLDQPSKWSTQARDGKGGSVPAERTDVNARYSVKVNFEPDTFDSSDFKQQIDDVWGLAQAEYKGKFKDTKPPYRLQLVQSVEFMSPPTYQSHRKTGTLAR